MTDETLHAGFTEDDLRTISDVWRSDEGGLLALIRAGKLDPKKDFVGGDFRGWPLANQDVRGIDFSGSDLRGTGINRAIRDDTTILTNAILDDLPSPDRSPSLESLESHQAQPARWTHHWHAGVHAAFGLKLHLIFLRFMAGSIMVKDSVVRDINEVGVTDYMILHLYSRFDVLIRVWADDSQIRRLGERFRSNPEINWLDPKDPIEIAQVVHFPDRGRYPTSEAVKATLAKIDTAELKDVQQKGNRSEHFERLRAAGLILDNETRFTANRIQFFISVNCAHDAAESLRESLLNAVERLRQVRSKTVYFPRHGRTLAIIKGQTQFSRYYDIHDFLRQVTAQFEMILRFHVETETMLVANHYHHYSSTINFDYARRDPALVSPVPIRGAVAGGEDDKTEFKSTLRTNLRTGERDSRMDMEVLKTIAAFVNSLGGKLIIGVNDQGKPIGLEADKFENEDRMNRHLVSLIRDKIGAAHIEYIRLRFESLDGHRVLIVECERGRFPAYVKDGSQERFFIRTGAATTELNGSNLTQYVASHFRSA